MRSMNRVKLLWTLALMLDCFVSGVEAATVAQFECSLLIKKTLPDSSAMNSSHNATFNAAVSLQSNSPFGLSNDQSVLLLGDHNNWATLANPATINLLNNGRNQFTLEAWFMPTTLQQSSLVYLEHLTPPDVYQLIAKLELSGDGKPLAALYTGDGWFIAQSDFPIMPNEWVHLAMVYNAASDGKVRLYVNGQTAAEFYAAKALPKELTGVRLGRGVSGLLDDVRISDVGLAATELGYYQAAGFWKLNQTSGKVASDSSRYNNSGVLVNGPVWTKTGNIGGALVLDGSDDYVRVNDADSLDLTSELSFSAWIRPTAGGKIQSIISKDGEGRSTRGAYNLYQTANLGIQYEVTGLGSLVSPPDVIMLSRWNHLALAYNAAASPSARLFVNGLEVAQGDVPKPLKLGTSVTIGRRGAGSNFMGQLDDVKILPRAISPAAAAQLYVLDHPPLVSIVSPALGSELSGVVSVDAVAQDDLGVQKVSLYVDGTHLKTIDQFNGAAYHFTVDSIALANGQHTFSVVAEDTVGQRSSLYDDSAYKKVRFLEWGWDCPSTAYVKDNVKKMEEGPFDALVVNTKGDRPDDAPFSWLVLTNVEYSIENLLGDIDNLSTTSFSKFKEVFAMFHVSTEIQEDIPDWILGDWTVPLSNVRLLGQVAKRGKLQGIMMDTEPYGEQIFSYEDQEYANQYTLEEYQDFARLRGQEVMMALNDEYHGITVLATWTFSLYTQDQYNLLWPFFAGMMMASDASTRFYDMGESAYNMVTDAEHRGYKRTMLTYAESRLEEALLADPNDEFGLDLLPTLMNKYYVGFGKWLDYDDATVDWTADPTDLQSNYYPPKVANSHSPGWQQVLMQAGVLSEQYVWVYSQHPDWWTGEDFPDAYRQATHDARTSLANGNAVPVTVTVRN